MKKNFVSLTIKALIFSLILLVTVFTFGKLFTPYDHEESSQSASFYEWPKDTVDVFITGSSNVRNGISPNELWKNYGIVAYTRGNSRQAPELAYFNFKEGLNYQNPKLLILGITQLFKEYDYVENEPFLRKGLDYKKMSIDKLQTAKSFTEKDSSQHIIDYALPLLRYHSRWSEIKYEDIRSTLNLDEDYRRGQYRVKKIKKLKARSIYDTQDEPAEINDTAWDYYKKTIDLAHENGIDVLIVVMPDDRWNMSMHKIASELTKECGVAFIDANMDEWIKDNDIIWSKDFYDKRHFNLEGCRKASEFIGSYIIENYDIPQWSCSDELKEKLDYQLSLYDEEYAEFMSTVYKK